MLVEITNRRYKGSSLLVQLEDEAGNPIFPSKLRGADGVTYRTLHKPEHGDYVEIRPDGGTWGVFKDTLEVVP